MAKNKKKAKKRNKYKYTKREFTDICCSQCNICDSTFMPELCYSELYTRYPKKFIKLVFKRLLRVSEVLHNSNNYSGKDKIEFIVKKVFCGADLCGNNHNNDGKCPHFSECTAVFGRQMGEGEGTTASSSVYKKERKKERYVAQPYPTFFTNGRQEFLDEIDGILSKEN